MASIVLVHGAWHGAWCWYKVKAALERRGHWVMAPDLAGHGANRTPDGDSSIARYIAPVMDAVERAPEPPVLVGHSMGGMIISLVAEQTSAPLRSLIYLCAFLPQNGESLRELARDEAAQLRNYAAIEGGTMTVRPEGIVPCFYADCTAEDITLARLLLQPQSLLPLSVTATLTAARFGAIPKHYLLCTQDQAISPAHQLWMATRTPDVPITELPTSHSPFFSSPALLARLIAGGDD